MENDHQNIERSLKNLTTYKVSSEADSEILKALSNRELERAYHKPSEKLNFLTQFNMLSKKLVSALAAFAVVASGLFYYTATTSYAYHLNKAQKALAELEVTLDGGAQPSAFVPAAYAENDEVDEDTVDELVDEVISETEVSIELAEESHDPEGLKVALEEIKALQAQEVNTFTKAVAAVEGAQVKAKAQAALDNTSDNQEEVEGALNDVDEALAAGDEEVEVDIETTIDIEAQANFDAAQAAVDELSASGDVDEAVLEKLQAKLDKAAAALESGKVGRVKGLTTAITSKVTAELRDNGDEAMDEDQNDGADTEEAVKDEGEHESLHEDSDRDEHEDEDKNKEGDHEEDGAEVSGEVKADVSADTEEAGLELSVEAKSKVKTGDHEEDGDHEEESDD